MALFHILAGFSAGTLYYKGCYVDNGSARSFGTYLQPLTLEDCVAAGANAGYNAVCMQNPEGAGATGYTAECWTQDVGVLSEDSSATYGKRADSECKGEAWDPVYNGTTFTANGAANRCAVYTTVPTHTASGLQLSNLALNKPSKQKSTLAATTSYPAGDAANANDGDPNGVSAGPCLSGGMLAALAPLSSDGLSRFGSRQINIGLGGGGGVLKVLC